MRKSAPNEVVVHYPKTKEGWDELGKRVMYHLSLIHIYYYVQPIVRKSKMTGKENRRETEPA